jgi:hypothetical protein
MNVGLAFIKLFGVMLLLAGIASLNPKLKFLNIIGLMLGIGAVIALVAKGSKK